MSHQGELTFIKSHKKSLTGVCNTLDFMLGKKWEEMKWKEPRKQKLWQLVQHIKLYSDNFQVRMNF